MSSASAAPSRIRGLVEDSQSDYTRITAGAGANFSVDGNGNNGDCGSSSRSSCSSDTNGNSDSGDATAVKCRKPSYVGLSCAISGYSSYVRYQSPSRKTSPSQIPVQTGPQTLDAVYNMRHTTPEFPPVAQRRISPPTRGMNINNNNNSPDCTDADGSGTGRNSRFSASSRKSNMMESSNIIYNSAVSKSTADTLREGSPGSDCSGSSSIGSAGSGSGGGGNLVAKQIERLYGGRVQAVHHRVTSPEPKESFDNNNKKVGGYFAKRLASSTNNGGSEERSSSPLEMKSPLKGPAVFRLLRPEFREQLKSSSCQVHIPSENQSHLNGATRTTVTHNITISNGAGGNNQATPVSSIKPLGYRVTTSRQNRERVVPISRSQDETSTTTPPPLKSATMVTRVTSKDTAVKERVIPIQLEEVKPVTVTAVVAPAVVTEDAKTVNIPIERTTHNDNNNTIINTNTTSRSPDKPALPAKPAAAAAPTPPPTLPSHVVTSPGLVANCFNNKVDEMTHQVEEDVEEEEVEEEEDYFQQHRRRDESSPSCGGTRERALLCPIQEEDTESTASTASFSRQTSSSVVAAPPAAAAVDTPAAAVNGVRNERESSAEEVQDGHYFIKVLENEIFKFEEQICDFEEELAASDNSADESKKIPDEVRDSILAANGKAKLLISQKLAQFRGLCDKNINISREEDPFVPTSEDLAGFWDMVYIQVEHINALFAELATLRKNGWVSKKPLNTSSSMLSGRRSSPTKSAASTTPKSAGGGKKSPASSSTKSSPAGGANTPDSAKKSEAAKARDEARKKMMEERRRMMREKKKELANNSSSADVVEVFVK